MAASRVQGKGKGFLALFAASHGVNHVYQLLTPLIIPKITVDYGLSNYVAGLLLFCFVSSYALLQVVSGYLSSKFGRRNILALGFATSALSFMAIGFTSNIGLIGLLLFLAVAGGSTYHPNGAPLLAESYPKVRGQNLGLHQAGGSLGSVIGILLAVLLVQSLTWKPALVTLAIPGLVTASVLWLSVHPAQPQETDVKPRQNSIKVANMGIYVPAMMCILAGFIFVLGMRGTDLFGNDYFVVGRGIGFVEASLFFVLLRVAGIFSSPLCGKLSDTFDRKQVLILLVVIESVSLYAITVTPVVFLAAPCIMFGFAAFGLLGVVEALLADITPHEQLNTIFGINYTASFSASIILAPTLGLIADHYSFAFGFVILSAIMLLSIPLIAKIKNTLIQRKQCPTPTRY